MKNLTKLNLLAFSISAFTLFSCEKEEVAKEPKAPDPVQVTEPCKLLKTRYLETYATHSRFSEEYIYDSQDKVKRINYFNNDTVFTHYITFTYNNLGKVDRSFNHLVNGSIIGNAEYSYDNAGLLTSVQFLLGHPVYFPYSFQPSKIVFHYDSQGRKSRLDSYKNNQPTVISHYAMYRYGQGVTYLDIYDASTTPATFVQKYEYQFDQKKSKSSVLSYLNPVMPYLDRYNLIRERLIQNNPNGDEHIAFDYTYGFAYNSYGYPVGLSKGGYPMLIELAHTEYTYACQD